MKKKNLKPMLCMAAALAVFGILQLVFGADSSMTLASTGLSLASLVPIGTIGNIDDVTDRDTHGSAISYIVYLYHTSVIDRTQAFPQPDENREVDTIPLVSGKGPIYFEAHDIPTLVSTTEKGDITTTGENNFVIIMGGDRDQIKTFIENYSGGKFVIVYKHIKETQWHILGELERPMILANTETKDDKDGRYTTFTFKRNSVDLPLLYTGDPTGTAAASTQQGGGD